MTDETTAPDEPQADDPGQQAYNDAYNAVVAQHEMTTANGVITCTCGDTGTVAVDMGGHFGEEARRAGAAARDAVQ